MVPIVLVSNDAKKIAAWLKKFIRINSIAERFVFEIRPLFKEFSIEQIKELNKNLIYNFPEPHLYILYDFDKASFEAQNAFLKTLEEHQETIHFVMIVKNAHKLADTVLSRSRILNLTIMDFVVSQELKSLLEHFLTSRSLKILGEIKLQSQADGNINELFMGMLAFFKLRLAKDLKTTKVLRKILETKYLVENNNVDPQSAIDQILLYIRNLYQTI